MMAGRRMDRSHMPMAAWTEHVESVNFVLPGRSPYSSCAVASQLVAHCR
jgi:hypothetical protein